MSEDPENTPRCEDGVLDPPDLAWADDDAPHSSRFDDVYFSREGGQEETHHVFLAGNDLPARWAAADRFVIGETGFGTGLNFLTAWEAWEATAPATARLHYFAVEGHPLPAQALRRALHPWEQLRPRAEALVAQFPPPFRGFHRLHLGGGRVTLTLLQDEADAALAGLVSPAGPSVDAWFLDGFAPARNPGMWSDEVCQRIAALTRPGGTFATYTAAGAVRRRLEQVGFDVERPPGFGRKREMMRGRLPGQWRADAETRRVAVIGAGLAGTGAARSLLARGCEVELIDRRADVAQETSGNPVGIVMPYLNRRFDLRERLYRSGFDYVGRRLEGTDRAATGWTPSGVLQLAPGPRMARRLEAIAARRFPDGLVQVVSPDEARRITLTPVELPGLHFPRAGHVHPPGLCRLAGEQRLAGEKRLAVTFEREALQLSRAGEGWRVLAAGGAEICTVDAVVVANALDAAALWPGSPLPLRRNRGQVTFLPATAESAALDTVICYDGYVLPAVNGQHTVGATFDPERTDTDVDVEDHRRNLDRLAERLPGWYPELVPDAATPGRVGFRCATPDHFPLVGAHPTESGLFISVGHGSRGLVSTPIAGEILGSWVGGEPLPLERELADALDPGRFG